MSRAEVFVIYHCTRCLLSLDCHSLCPAFNHKESKHVMRVAAVGHEFVMLSSMRRPLNDAFCRSDFALLIMTISRTFITIPQHDNFLFTLETRCNCKKLFFCCNEMHAPELFHPCSLCNLTSFFYCLAFFSRSPFSCIFPTFIKVTLPKLPGRNIHSSRYVFMVHKHTRLHAQTSWIIN